MNQYGAQAMRHWRAYLPDRYATLPDPSNFFSILGEQAASQIEMRTLELAGPDQPGEGYLDKLGRLNAAKQMAEEEILRELVLIDPEANRPASETSTSTTPPAGIPVWTPLVEDPSDPWWQRVAEEEDDGDDPATPAQ